MHRGLRKKNGKNCHHRPGVPKVWVAKDQEMWILAEAIQTSELIADIEKEYSNLLLKSSIQSFFENIKYALLEAWVVRCSPGSDLGHAQKSFLGTAAIFADWGGFHPCLELPQYSSRNVACQVYRKLE